MVGIPEYEKVVPQRVIPNQNQTLNIDPASVAGMYLHAGNVISRGAGSIEQGLQSIGDLVEKEQQRTDKLAVDSQYASFVQEADQFMADNVTSKKGTFAPAPETVRAGLDSIRQKYIPKFETKKAQDEFFSAANQRMISAVTVATAHREKEYEQAQVESSGAKSKDAANTAITLFPIVGSNHPQFTENINSMRSAIQTAGEVQGLPQNAIKLQQAQAVSGVFASIVQGQLAAGNTSGAKITFDVENAKGTFDPGTRNALMATLKNHTDLQTAAEDLQFEGAKLPQIMDPAMKYGAVNDLINKSGLSEERKREAIKLNTARLEDYTRANNAQRIAKNERYMKDLGALKSEQEAIAYAANIPDALEKHKFLDTWKGINAPAIAEKDMADAQTIRQAIDRGNITVGGLDGKPITIPVQNDSDIANAARMSRMTDNVVRDGVAYFRDRSVKDSDLRAVWGKNLPGDVDPKTYKLPPSDFYPFVRNRLPAGQTATPEFLASATREYLYEKGSEKRNWIPRLFGADPSPTTRYEYMKSAKKGFENFSTDLKSRAQTDMMIAYEKKTGKKPSAPPDERTLNLFIQDKIRKGEYNAR